MAHYTVKTLHTLLLLLPLAVMASAETNQAPRVFGAGRPFRHEELPQGTFRRQVEQLTPKAQARAALWMQRFSFPAEDVASLRTSPDGEVFYACTFPIPPAPPRPVTARASGPQAAPIPVAPFPNALKFHSRPGASHVIHLDFDGDSVSGTAWNGSEPLFTPIPFSTDGDSSTYSDAEQAVIKRVWQRVAEDFAPFDVDVTTERPAVMGTNVSHAIITRSTDSAGRANPHSSAGGVAFIGVHNEPDYAFYRPAWVYADNLGYEDDYMSEAASHEVGHNLGLSHDGLTDGTEYYNGHGSGETSWGPIMGTGYNRDVSQWSKGEYYLANNTQDDLAIITSRMPYLADDVGNTTAAARPLVVSNQVLVLATTPETDPGNANTNNKGLLARASDADVFRFTTVEAGQVNLTVSPWVSPINTRGGNLDLQLTLLDSGGNFITNISPSNTTYAVVRANVATGEYYLVISNSWWGAPKSNPPSGYTNYASIGQYFISGTLPGVFTSPVLCAATADGPQLVRLSWQDVGYTVLVAHAQGSPPGMPVNGTSYAPGAGLSPGTVVARTAANYAEHEVAAGSTNYYVFYSVAATATLYSAGVTVRVVTAAYPEGILEPFCYTGGVSLAARASGQGFSGAWTTMGGTFVVRTGGPPAAFSFSEPFPSASGQRVAVDNYTVDTEMRSRRAFPPATNGALYLAYRVAIEYGGNGKYTGVRLLSNATERLFVGETGGSDVLGVDGLGTGIVNSPYGLNSYEFAPDNAYLIVGRFLFSNRQWAAKAFYVTQPVPVEEPDAWDVVATAAVDRTYINGLELVTGGFSGNWPGRVFFDEIRVASSWLGLLAGDPAGDSDGDGLSDGWERQHFASITGGVGAADGDLDGFSNLDEFGAGTDPSLNGSSPAGAWPRVLGTNGQPVVNGSTTPDAAAGTDFGPQSPCFGTVDRLLCVSNVGPATLTLYGATLVGDPGAEFAIVEQPSVIQPGGCSNLVLRFDPWQFGARTATVFITHSGASNVPYRFAVAGQGHLDPAPASAAPAPASPATAGDPPGQNAAGDQFDLATNGTPFQTTVRCGFGNFGRVYVNYDETYLYLGGEGLDVAGENNGAIVFLGLDTLTDNASSPAQGTPFTNPPYGLNLLNNLAFSTPMDVAILLGDEFGDGLFRDFLLGGGQNFGQGVFYLSATYYGISNAIVSQFDGAGAAACVGEDDDGNRMTDRWKVAIPWTSLNAPLGAASVSNLTMGGVLVGGSFFDSRYISGNHLGTMGGGLLDENSNFAFHSVTLTPHTVALRGQDFDGDGMPDGWELDHNLSALESNTPGSDADSDGWSDRDEYIADTHPNDNASYFPVMTNAPGAIFSLQVGPTSTGRLYDLHWRTNLVPEGNAWIPFGFSVTGNGSMVTFTVTNEAPRRVFRTGVRMP